MNVFASLSVFAVRQAAEMAGVKESADAALFRGLAFAPMERLGDVQDAAERARRRPDRDAGHPPPDGTATPSSLTATPATLEKGSA